MKEWTLELLRTLFCLYLTDVSRASSRNLIQRPCHESDAVADCRLTDPIVPDLLPEEFGERMKLWNQAHCE